MNKDNVSLVIAGSWEDADADPVRELMEKVEKVKLLQRKEEKKEAYFEKVKAEEHSNTIPKLQTEEGLGPSGEEPKRVFLRRPKDGFSAESVVESSPPSTVSTGSQPASRSRPHHKSNQKDSKQPAPTYEERQAAYQAARNRILGTEYKPDNQEIKEIKFIDRSKSPETLKMTEKNMVEHYGEELSRELMQQPVETLSTPETLFVPDYTQPPPCVLPSDGAGIYNIPPGFQQRKTNFPPNMQQNFEGHYYMQNGQLPVQYVNSGQMQQFIPQDSTTMIPQSTYVDSHNEQAYYYCPPAQQQMFQSYMQNGLPNMAYPPPNFQMQCQQNRQLINQMNQPQMLQIQPSQTNGQLASQYQMQSGMGRGNNAPTRGSSNGGIGRGQNRPQMTYSANIGNTSKPTPLMYPIHDRGPTSNVQSYTNRSAGNGQRLYQSPTQQNGQLSQNNSALANVRKPPNKNGKPGQRGIDNSLQKTNFGIPQTQTLVGQNPIPFGCPPPYVDAIREQHANSMSPNTGAGILGAHPMASSQWPALPQNLPH